METVIIKSLKTLNRAKLVNFILKAIHKNLLTSTAKEARAMTTNKAYCRRLTNSKHQDHSEACFCGFKIQYLQMRLGSNSENYAISKITKFSFSYDSLQKSYNENEDCGEANVEQIAVKHQTTSGEQESDDDTTELQRVTIQAAMKSTCRKEMEAVPCISALQTCADFVQLRSTRTVQQATLDQFL
jgi:hypothetical protein